MADAAASLNETYLTALCIWREMRGASHDERVGCYWVIRNRANDEKVRWPRTMAGVVTQRYQFSSFNVTDPGATRWPLDGLGNADWVAWQEIVALVNAPPDDPTGGANRYENLPSGATKPGWAEQGRIVKAIGGTRFYKL
jgi:hypothetical protein